MNTLIKYILWAIAILLAACVITWLSGCSDRKTHWIEQVEVIPPPVDMSHCEGNTIYMGKPKCGGE